MPSDPRMRRSFTGAREVENDPKAIEAESKIAQRLRGRRSTQPDCIDGTDVNFVWRILMGSEKQEVTAGACRRFEDLGLDKEFRWFRDIEDEMVWQILFRAMRDPDYEGDAGEPYPKTLAHSVDELRDLLTVEERDKLVSRYLDFEEVINPPIGNPEIFFDQINEAVKKNDSPAERMTALLDFGSHLLASYILFSESQQSTSPTSSSSGTSGPSNNSKPTQSAPPKTQSETENAESE
ncbi:hypothetical protein LCGC14_1295800 [marine sediment metagenome]|uniref:Uncharacterized protein n=1 Tax=marine sediment metagenome TaxID=412755 RepID=A0A0F9KSW7_9ZZZZ